MIGWEYPPLNSGGLGVACKGLTKALADQNTDIYFTLPYSAQQKISHMKVLSCFDSKSDKASLNVPPFPGYSSLPTSTLLSAVNMTNFRQLPTSQMEQQVGEYAQKVEKISQDHKDFELIHAHDWMSFPSGIKLKQKYNKPLVAHVHSTEFDRIPNGQGSNYIIHTEKEGLINADKIIAVSNYTKNILIEKYKIKPKKIEVVYNGISSPPDTSSVSTNFALERPVILFLGRLTMQKGADYFVSLAHSILKKIPTALFVVAGDGDQFHSLMLKNADLGLSANLLFTGFVRGKDKIGLLKRANVFVMPSLSEPFGLVAVEAAQMNTPVIISKNSGVAEVMPSALQVDFWDIDKMTAVIEKIVSSKKISNRIVSNQLHDLNQISWQSSAQRLKQIYNSIFLGN